MDNKKEKEFCKKHPDMRLITDDIHHVAFCPRCEKEKIEEEETSKEKPLLNAARLYTIGSYRVLYDIQSVDEKKKLWKGRPVIEPALMKLPGSEKAEAAWVFFTREYDDRSDWDRLYKEHWFEDESIIGQKFLAVPKEKLLFAYEPPPSGIILPPQGIAFGRS